jgi:integrase
MNKKDAEEVCRRVESLLTAKLAGTSLDRETAAWVGDIEGKIRDRLVKFELIEKPADKLSTATLDAFIRDYLATRSDIKPSTRTNLERARDNLVTFFGADKPLAEITPGDADEFRLWLRRTKPTKPGEPKPPGLADNTARRTCGRAKQFFKAAKKKHLITANPFEEIGDCQVRANKSRERFITADEAKQVLAAIPGVQWQLVFALSRYGGLRCPSEHARLRPSDVDWANNRFTVHSPKTEHHGDGHESRVVPIFPELRPYLKAACDAAPKDAEYLLTLKGMARNRLTGKSANVGTTMAKFVKRAGLTPWPKLFQNLRSSRQTELEAQGFPTHVVCSWLGNSPKVANEHYLRTTEADFVKAAGVAEKSAGMGAGQDTQDGAQDHTPPQAATLKKIIAKVLEENGLDANPCVISQLAEIKNSSPGRTRSYSNRIGLAMDLDCSCVVSPCADARTGEITLGLDCTRVAFALPILPRICPG